MATFALIHGGGSSAWDWHLVRDALTDLGHEVVAVDLPIESKTADLEEYAQTVTDAVGGRQQVIVVGHSLGGFTAPLACEQLDAEGLVYLAGMIPAPGESFEEWWTNTGHDREIVDSNPDVSFFNDVPDALAREARERDRDQQGEWMSRPWPGERHPAVPTGAILCLDDQFFPASFMRRHVRERLGIEPVEIAGGHYAALTNPSAIAATLDDFARDVSEHATR